MKAIQLQPYRPRLGIAVENISGSGLQVSVIDRQGRPVKDVDLKAYDNGREVGALKTDPDGDAVFPISIGPFDISATYEGHLLWKEATPKQIARGETIVFELPFCVNDAILKPMDLGLLAAAGALAGAGVYFKVQPLTMAGEVVFGAAMFSIIYRLSCI